MRNVLAIIFLLPLIGFAEDSKILMNEDFREWARNQIQGLSEKRCEIALDDILPEEDKGKTFDPSIVEEHFAAPLLDSRAKEIENLMQTSVKKEALEGTEPFLQMSKMALENPNKELDMKIHTSSMPEEEKLETCLEAGCYQISFAQNLEVEVTPELKELKKSCMGHRVIEEFFWKESAERRVHEQNYQMVKDSSLSFYGAYIGGQDTSLLKKYYVISEWRHKDNQEKCSFPWKEHIIQPYAEKELWKTDSPEGLSATESNPDCKFLFSQVLKGPETRLIKGSPVFRSVWGRNLLFSCEPNPDSPCAKLRKLGGVLIKRKCLKENSLNDCDLWQKTYDMGGKASHQKHSYSFKDREIWGFNGIFDESYEKNKDFSTVAAILGIFSDMKKEIEKQGDLNKENVRIFMGEPFGCACSFWSGELFDCCKKMEGLAISAYLAKCNSEELALTEKKQDGKCHFIGSRQENLGTKTTKVFCCFATKLSRVVQEQGRDQLNIDWGKADSPDCRGLSLDELTRLDFSKIDLSEVVEDLAIDKEELFKKIGATISHLESSGSEEGSHNTREIIQKEEERVQHVNPS